MPDVKFSNLYPYTDFHELNLDWVISQVKYWSERVGKSIQTIEKTGTAGLVDTYTITYSDGTTSTFDVTNGNGISSVAKTGTVGLVDTYTITFQDGSTSTFEVHNGTTSIDPTLSLSDYAADAKATGDAIAEVEDAVSKIETCFDFGVLTKNDPIFTAKTGYNASSAGWVANAQYNSYYFTTTEKTVFYTSNTSNIYYAISIYNGAVSAANFIARYRNTENNLPTKNAPLTVNSGYTVVVTIEYRDTDFELYASIMPLELSDNIMSDIVDHVTSLSQTKVEKTTGKYLITSNGIVFDMRHSVDALINQDCWRFVSVSKNGTDLVSGDIIGVLMESGQADFMGGVHGDEINIDFKIFGDGIEITDPTTYCDKLDIYMYSHLYRVSSPSTNVVDRYVHIEIEQGIMTVSNTFVSCVNNFNVDVAYNSGLLGVFKPNMTFFSSNTAVADLDNMPASWNASHYNYWYDIFMTNAYIRIENIVGKEQQNYSTRVQYFSDENPQRLKIYMTTDTGSEWNTGHVCNGKFKITFK